MRLDRYLTASSILTRSQAAKAIRNGRVSVNGMIERKPERRIEEESDRISLDGTVCGFERYVYYLLDKPKGLITASRDRTQETVLDLFPQDIQKKGIFPVGRLDKDTSGLLLLTNDGDFAHRVISPKSRIDKCYLATVDGILTQEDQKRFQSGICLADGTQCLPARLEILGERDGLITVQEGKYHQVRRMMAAIGKPVLSLRRLSIGGLYLPEDSNEGDWRQLSDDDLCILFNSVSRGK